MTIEPDAIYLPSEVAEYLRCGKSNVYDLIQSKKLAALKVSAGKLCLRVKGSDVLAFVDSCRDGGSASKGSFKRLAKYLN